MLAESAKPLVEVVRSSEICFSSVCYKCTKREEKTAFTLTALAVDNKRDKICREQDLAIGSAGTPCFSREQLAIV